MVEGASRVYAFTFHISIALLHPFNSFAPHASYIHFLSLFFRLYLILEKYKEKKKNIKKNKFFIFDYPIKYFKKN